MKWTALLLGVFVGLLAAPPAHSKTLNVQKWGQDSSYCGPAGEPCETINQAIENADPGTTIRVGPGIYGDANMDGDFDDLGDEFQPCAGWNSIVCIDKDDLKLESAMGARHTLIYGIGGAIAGVCISGDHVRFGKKKGGFTIRNASYGVVLNADGLTVQGIRAVSNSESGFLGEQLPGQGHHVLIDNEAVDNRVGFSFRGTQEALYIARFSRNRSRDNASDGITVSSKSKLTMKNNISVNNHGSGFFILSESGTTIQDNVASANHIYGFYVQGGHDGTITISGNSASHNDGVGFKLTSARNINIQKNVSTDNYTGIFCSTCRGKIWKNIAAGNRRTGIYLLRNGPSEIDVKVENNNIYGNGWEFGTNCGLYNMLGEELTVKKNFWGDAGGPGPDPADDTCGDVVVETAPAKKPVKLKLKIGDL